MHGVFTPTSARYVLTGITVALFYGGLYAGFSRLAGWAPALASGVAMVCAIGLQYFMHAVFTFQMNWRDRRQAARFVITIASGLSASQLVIGWAVPHFHIPEIAGLAFVVVVLPLVNFIFFSLWVFAQR